MGGAACAWVTAWVHGVAAGAAGWSRSAHRSSITPASSAATRPRPTLLRALAAALAASLASLASAACALPAPGEARDAPDARSRTASLA